MLPLITRVIELVNPLQTLLTCLPTLLTPLVTAASTLCRLLNLFVWRVLLGARLLCLVALSLLAALLLTTPLPYTHEKKLHW